MSKSVKVIKIGGKVIEDEQLLDGFLKSFAELDFPKVLIHGGGRTASEISEKLGIEPQMIEGRRKTDEDTLDVVLMVYGGLVNKKIVSILQGYHCNALGITGADGNIIRSIRRPPEPFDLGFVGDIQEVNAPLLKSWIEQDVTPVIAPLTHDREGQMFNTNADSIAGHVAAALGKIMPVELVFCFEKKGVLKDPEDDESYIPTITQAEFPKMKEDGIVSEGMIPKLESAFATLEEGVQQVTIAHHGSLPYLGKKNFEGTIIRL